MDWIFYSKLPAIISQFIHSKFTHHLVNSHPFPYFLLQSKLFSIQVQDFQRFFRLTAMAFRVMAPPAAQGAAFEKYRSTDSRSVMDRKPPDIEDQTFIHCKI